MLHSVSILLLLLFSLNFSHDFKMLVLAEDELQDSSTLDCGGEPSCYRKGNPYKSNGSTIGSEIQTSRQLLMADLDRAASHGVLSPSISYSQSRLLPSTAILSPAQNMLNNSKLASSANISASVVESPSISSGNLRSKVSNGPLLCTIKTPQFCSLSPPSLAVQPSVHPSTHKQNFANLVLDHMPHLGIPNFSVPQGVTSRSLIPCAHVHNVLSFVSPYRSFHQEANHNGAPYFLIPPCSLTTGNMKHIEAASLPYYSVRSGPSFSLTQDRQSEESLRFGKYTHSVPLSRALPVTAPSLLTMHYGQPQDPSSPRVQAPENQPSVRFLPPSNDWPVQTLPPIASDGEKAQGLFVNENQPPKALPPMLASPGSPTVTSPPLLSPHDHQYQMHPSAFHPVMPNPSTYTEWLSPRVFGTPSQMRPPVEHSWTSVSPSGTVSSPTSLPSELSEPPEAAPSIIFPSHGHHHNMRGSVASSPSIFPSEPPQKKPSTPFTSWPRNIPKGQAPLALAPRIQEHVIPPISLPSRSPMEYPGRPASAPSIAFHSPQYHRDENMQGPGTSSPSIFPSTPHQMKPSIPVAPQPMNRSKRQTPVALAPKNQEPVIPSISVPSNPPVEYPGTPEADPSIGFHSPPHNRNVKGPSASPPRLSPSISHRQKSIIPVPYQPGKRSRRHSPAATAPIIQGTISSPTSLPSELYKSPEAAPSIIFPSHGHHHNMRGSVASTPSIFPSEPPQKKPNTPFSAWPRNIPKGKAPLALAPRIQEHVIPPMSLPSRSPVEYPGRSALAPSIAFHSPQYHRDKNEQGPAASSPSIFPSVPHQKKPSIPVAPRALNRSKRQTPVALAPKNQEPVTPSISVPSKPPVEYQGTPVAAPSIRSHSTPHNQNVKGPAFPPRISPPISHRQKSIIPVPNQPGKKSWRHSPATTAPFIQGPVSTPSITPPPEQPNSRTIFAPSIVFPPPSHYPRARGHLKPPGNTPSEPPQKQLRIPVASPPRIRSWWHAPAGMPPTNQGYFSSPPLAFPPEHYRRHSGILPFPPSIAFAPPPYHRSMEGPVAVPTSFASSKSPAKMPYVPWAAPPSKRSSSHAPTVIPPINQGPISSPIAIPFEPPKDNLRHPAPAPSRISPIPHHYWGMEGPVASTPSMIPSAPAQKKPNEPVAAPPSKRSSKHAPVASPPMVEGPVYSPVNHPLLSPSGNLRPPAVSPSVRFPSPPHHRHVKGPSASPAPASSRISPTHHYWGMKGPVASTPTMIPSAPAQEKPSTPMAAPPSKTSSKHAPVASPPIVEGPAYSPVNHPLLSPSGNLRSPTVSPSIGSFPPHHRHAKGPSASSARITPSEPPQMTRGIPLAAPPLVFPPPPPSQDCNSISCTQPFTSTPPGAPCGCVYPMQVELELGVALYAFFPLVSELAAEIAAGTFLKQSQVRIMGANADSQDQEKTIVILDLVPLGEKFDNTTAFLIFERFWQKKVIINGTLFGSYWVIFVTYPGLPPPPPSAFSNANIDGEPTNSSGPSKHEPLGVDINKRSKKMGTGIIAVVALSSAIGAVICVGAVWIILLKCKNRSRPSSAVVEPTSVSSVTKRSGGCGGSILSGSTVSSTSISFASSMAPYTGSAKTITLAELERATDRFNLQNVLGEGGFGRVYRGVLEDGTKVAVKVLTRDDQQGGREFIAEVEMLSRLHHRNLVKLIGICTEEHNRSLVYELIPNGSVESHLHGLDKETAPLDWDARIKIALGAARGLAYLHEDSSPRVIHRDFKASNILLEEDFTPKVSDFGLAKSASEEVSGHISTRVMGTFGYVAPEYAMTGHLLVKSDVYSYGVVLLELLTGRKPVDMSQPPGQENLVTWARPLLTSKEGLEALVDPALGSNLPFDNIARVAAIASMCVQPEVSHRPFMGEVVQALKLVYNDSDASNGGGSGSFSQGGESYVHDTEVKDGSSQQWAPSIQYIPDGSSFVTIDYDSGPLQTQGLVTERPLSASALLSTSGSLMRQLSGSFRRHSNSGPLRTNKSKKSSYGGVRGLAGGSISEHGVKRHEDVHELWP